MIDIVEKFRKKGKLFKNIVEISPKELGIRNKIKIYKALDTGGYFYAIFVVQQKTKILTKDIEKFETIYKKLVLYVGHNFKYKILLLDAPICSKAKKGFKEACWRVDASL